MTRKQDLRSFLPRLVLPLSDGIRRKARELENLVDKTGGYCIGSDGSTKEEFVSSWESIERTMEFFERSETRH